MTPPDALNIIESNLDYLIQTDQLESAPNNRIMSFCEQSKISFL